MLKNRVFYGILVKFGDGTYNINEAYETETEARAAIGQKLCGHLAEIYENGNIVIDTKLNITYEIKQIIIYSCV